MLIWFEMASRWLHLIASVVWLGGITLILFVAIPAAKMVMGTEAASLMGEISARFSRIANYSILALVVTGAIIMALGGQPTGPKPLGSTWLLALIIKHALAVGMVGVHFFRILALAPRSHIPPAEPEA